MSSQTIIALATAPGEAGISVLRLSGPRAVELAGRLFTAGDGRSLQDQPARFMAHGSLITPSGELLDEVLAVRFEAPASYTGEDVVELHAHGGTLHAQRLLQACLSAVPEPDALRLALAGEFTQRAFINGKLDLTRAEAVADLIHSGAALSSQVAARQLDGQLFNALDVLRRSLLSVLAQAEAACDFPEEEGQLASRNAWAQELERAAQGMDSLLSTAKLGRLSSEGARVVLCGAPNAGKSSLMNALLEQGRSLVHAEAGTTRDYVEAALSLQGLPVTLIDTAGLREGAADVEQAGILRSREQIARADLVLYLCDQSSMLETLGMSALAAASCPVLMLATKADLAPAWELGALGSAHAGVLRVSTLDGIGIAELRERMLELLTDGRGLSVAAQALLTKSRHVDALRRARVALHEAQRSLSASASPDLLAGDLRASLDAVGELVGATTRAELVEEIFRRFCVGK